MHDLLGWIASLPPALLYGVMLVAAFMENVFPPLPADTVIAVGAFAAATGHGSALGAWTATMIGNIGGAMLMFAAGRRYGMPWLQRRFPSLVPVDATHRFVERVQRHGIGALVLSRFLPGVRAIVPPVAGAIGIRAAPAAAAMTLASGVWSGVVCWMAFRAGANAEVFLARVVAQQRVIALAAVVVVVCGAGVVLWRRAAAQKRRR